MKKLVLSAVMALCLVGITYAFASDIQKTDSVKTKSAIEIQKAVPEKPGSNLKTQKTVPFKAKSIDKNVAKIANAVLPKVVYPTMTHHLGYDGLKFSITVRFNTDIDRNTVVAGSTVIFNFPKAANAPGQITWINDREFKWVQQSNSRFDICIYNPDCEFKLTLTDGILSKEGLKLDGDNDNKQGGNFTIWFIDLG
ncbi:MAG: hypothetical protein RBR35_14330 [Salinivirgaceae bacterium]|nr:hypothetical protein [Salinivirgaceae bacterium]